MPQIFDAYSEANTRLDKARKLWESAIEESAAFEVALAAAKALEEELEAKGGDKSEQDDEDHHAAQADTQSAAAAFAESEQRVETAAQAVATAKAVVKALEPLFDQWLEEQESERRRARAEEARKRSEKRREQFWSRANDYGERAQAGGRGGRGYTFKRTYTKDGETVTEETYTSGGAERPRPEEPKHPQPPPKPSKPKPTKPQRQITVKEIQDWHQACVIAFLNKPNMRTLPEPPSEPCTNPSCAVEDDRALEACKCNLRKIFSGPRKLKQDRHKFHPDRFGACPEDVRDEIQNKAKEVFVVVDAMYQGR